jgi:cell division protein FtsA
MDTRVGYPNEHLAGDTDKDVTIPLFATAVGLVLDGLRRFEKDINEKVKVKETNSEDGEENQQEQESEVRNERTPFLEAFKEKLTEFLDNAE